MFSENARETRRILALQRTALFGCLTEKELSDIAQYAVELQFKKGEMLFLSGKRARGLFLVVSGKIRVFQNNAEGREQVMNVDVAVAVIGEVAVFDDGPYPASAISERDAEVLFIDKSDMHQFCSKYPSLGLNALQLMALQVRKHAQLVEALSFHVSDKDFRPSSLRRRHMPTVRPRGELHSSFPYRIRKLPVASAR